MLRVNSSKYRLAGFTLLETLVSMAVLTLILLMLSQMINMLQLTFIKTTQGLQEFKEAREAFESMTRRISQSTLNSYDDINPNNSSTTIIYNRASELRFISGDATTIMPAPSNAAIIHPTNAIFFQAPLGYSNSYSNLKKLLNTCGYYIEWNSDAFRPGFINTNPKWRYRLMEMIEPSDNLDIYNYTSGPGSNPSYSKSWSYTGKDWFNNVYSTSHVLASNIVFLAIVPMLAPLNAQSPAPDGTSTDILNNPPNCLYDTSPAPSGTTPAPSQNQLPPMVYLEMIAIDESSFARYQGTSTTAPLPLTGLATNASYTSRVNDVNTVTTFLSAHHIDYHIFSQSVVISGN